MNHFVQLSSHRNTDLAPIFPFEVFSIILDYVTHPRDLAALSSVCRVLHFLTAPRLFTHVWLDTTTPQLLQGLAALQNTTYSSLVRRLEVRGDGLQNDRENELLAFAVGGTIGSMGRMEMFHWKCQRRIPRSLYEALSLSKSLKSLIVENGTDDKVMSGFLLPAFRSLRSLTVSNIDCEKTEDWSRVLLSCGGIKELRLGWRSSLDVQSSTPGGGLGNLLKTLIERASMAERYRADSVASGLPIHQIMEVGKRLSLEVLEIQNLHVGEGDATLDMLFDLTTLTRLSVLGCQINSTWPYAPVETVSANSPSMYSSSSGGMPTPSSLSSLGSITFSSAKSTTPKEQAKPVLPNLKIFRSDVLTQWTIKTLSASAPLEAIYLLDPDPIEGITRCEDDVRVGLVHAIAEKHGSKLRNLRLSARMLLVGKDFVKIARGCQVLREWGLTTEPSHKAILQLTMPFMTLKTCAFLYSPLLENTEVYCHFRLPIPDDKKKEVEAFLAHEWFQDLKYLGIGGSVFRGDDTILENPNAEPPTALARCMPDGGGYYTRGVTVMAREDWPANSIFTEGENKLIQV